MFGHVYNRQLNYVFYLYTLQSIPKVLLVWRLFTPFCAWLPQQFCTPLHQKVMVKKGEADIPGLTVPRQLHSVSVMGWVGWVRSQRAFLSCTGLLILVMYLQG